MKSNLCAIFFSCALAVVAAQMCREQEECEESQCCSGIPPFGGMCTNFTAEGGKCELVPRTAPIFGDFIIGPCPCTEGLVCVQEGKKKNKGICQQPPTTAAAPVTAEEADDSAAEEPAAVPEAK